MDIHELIQFNVSEREHKNCKLSLYDQSNKSVSYIKGCKTIPITFKNAEPLDTPLRFSKNYKSVEY